MHTSNKGFVRVVLDNSLLLLLGTAAALLWANLDAPSYDAVAHPLHFWVNDVGMVFFFALAAKEVFEATLPGGSLASLKQAVAPIAAAVGGMLIPAAIFVGLAVSWGASLSSAAGQSRVRPTLRSRPWSRASSSMRATQPSRSFSCWRLSTTHSG
jgi:Na+/H+ antiporter NhaA